MAQRLSTRPGPVSLALGLLRPKRRRAIEGPAPPLELIVDRVPIDPEELSRWRAACGFEGARERHDVPLPYLFVLGFYAQAKLLLDRDFPLSPLGMVHVACLLEESAAIRAGDLLSLHVSLQGWRQVRKGHEVDVEIAYLRDGEPVARGLQTSLALGGGSGEKAAGGPRPGPPDQEFETWRLDSATGRRYARVSGDWNPIHLWPWTASLFGYRRPIAHGMYLVSRAYAGFDAADPEDDRLHRLEVRFKTPTDLPAKVRCYRRDDGFELWRGDGSRPHVSGHLTRL